MSEQDFFGEAPTGNRFLILNDLTQTFPMDELKVVDAVKRKSSAGKEYSVLVLEDDKGQKYDVSCWARDVKACLLEYGGNPTTWGPVLLSRGATRMCLIPAKKLTATVENIGE